MKEQKIVKVDSDYEANRSIEKLNKDGWLVSQISAVRSQYTEACWLLFEREIEKSNIQIND